MRDQLAGTSFWRGWVNISELHPFHFRPILEHPVVSFISRVLFLTVTVLWNTITDWKVFNGFKLVNMFILIVNIGLAYVAVLLKLSILILVMI